MKKLIVIFFILFWTTQYSDGQICRDSIYSKRLTTILAIDAVILTGTYITLNQLWYKDYPQSQFHWFNDGSEWLQVDKIGHAFSTYHISSIYSSQLKWCGLNNKNSAIYGASLGFINISLIELLDAKSEAWGASAYDLLANGIGSALFVGQQIFWEEEKIKFKFSFHKTKFPKYRPETLGKGFYEQILKDYNGQTYWLSANISSLFNTKTFPKWLNIAVGYSASGMTGGNENITHSNGVQFKRERQVFLSLDLDLSKIPTRKKWLKKAFNIINIIKFPAPALEIRSNNLYGHYLYF